MTSYIVPWWHITRSCIILYIAFSIWHHLYHGTTTSGAPHSVPGSTALLILKSPVTVTVTTQGVVLYFTNWQTGPNPNPHMWHHQCHDTATSGAPQMTYQCVHCLVECMTELPGWLVPSPLLILIHTKITSDCDSITTQGVVLYFTNWQTDTQCLIYSVSQ